ncbi:hypothetical protein ACSU1N_03930 [Thermogladius sp. 4427co]
MSLEAILPRDSRTATIIAWIMLPSTRRASNPISGFSTGRRPVFNKSKTA